MEVNLLCPSQMREAGVTVNDTPLRHIPPEKRNSESHSIIKDSLHIPLSLHGGTVISYFKVRKPTEDEVNDPTTYPHINMTNDSEWDPYDESLSHQEDTLYRSLAIDMEYGFQGTVSSITSCLSAISCVFDNDVYLERLQLIKFRTTTLSSTLTKKRRQLTPEDLALKWFIGIETAKRTIEKTTQRGIRDFSTTSGSKRMKHTAYQLKYRHLRATVYTDTMFATVKSLRQNTCAQLYVTSFHWTRIFPMKRKSEAHLTLDVLFREVGVFNKIVPDNALELTDGEFRRKAIHAGAAIRPVEAYTHNQNLAESAIRELRRMYKKAMLATNAPHVLWDYCMELMAQIRSHLALDLLELQGDTPSTALTGDTSDISNLCEFRWYDLVWFVDPTDKMENKKLARYLGPSHDIGQAMSSKLLSKKAQEISRTSVIPLSVEDKNNPAVQEKINEYSQSLSQALGERMAGIPIDTDDEIPQFEPYSDDSTGDEPTMEEADTLDYNEYNKFISAQVILPRSGEKAVGRVIKRKRDEDGHFVGKSHSNPLLDTTLYDVEFEDGLVETYAANQIAEGIFAQVDDEGREYLLIDEIVDHKRTGEALSKDDGFVMHNGRSHPRRTTKGWQLCVKWKDGSHSWEHLKDLKLKESNPVEVAEYAVLNKISSEPAFVWWVPYTIKKKERILSRVATRYERRNQKFGIEIPKTVKRVLEIDRETGTNFWGKAIRKEMSVILPAVELYEKGVSAPVGYQQIPCHMVFDIKMDFTRKARYVAGGHVTDPPTTQTYASVVSRDSVRIAFLLAALNDLSVLSADIQGAYLNAPCKEKVYTICGHEFGIENVGRVAVIKMALYGLKTSAFAWREHLSETLCSSLEFKHCYADNDVWLRPATKKDGFEYYEMVLVHTDDLLCLSENPDLILNQLNQHYLLKEGSVGKPTTYLGAKVGEYRLPDDPSRPRWYMSSETYLKEAIRNVRNWLRERNQELKLRASSVLPSNYRPELDATDYCNEDESNYFQQQIGVLRWAVELGRIDITAEVSMLAAYTAAPRFGHFSALMHVFSYLEHHDRSKVVFDDAYVHVNDEVEYDWEAFYPGAVEEIPKNALSPRGNPVQIRCYVDADHAGDLLTRRSRTGVLLYLNSAPIIWYSKKQNSIETSTYGSEYIALKTGIEIVKGMRYKLRMLGVPIDGHAHMRVDNMSVVKNSSVPESVLKKKSNSIAYHFVRESVAARIARVAYEESGNNKADMLTKNPVWARAATHC